MPLHEAAKAEETLKAAIALYPNFPLALNELGVVYLKMGQAKMAEQYKQHVIDQGLTQLRAHDNIRCLFTTPKLLEALCEKVSLRKLGITGVFCGGTEMTPQFHRFAVEELLEGAYFAPTYGNTLMGLAVHKPRQPGDNYAIIYYPPHPRAMIEVVDADRPDRLVDYGDTGRVRLTTLTKEFFMPRFLERDGTGRVVADVHEGSHCGYAEAGLGTAVQHRDRERRVGAGRVRRLWIGAAPLLAFAVLDARELHQGHAAGASGRLVRDRLRQVRWDAFGRAPAEGERTRGLAALHRQVGRRRERG